MIDVYKERFEHPYLLMLVPAAGILLGLAIVMEVLEFHMAAGFLALYSMVALIILTIGYIALYTLKYSTAGVQWWRMRDSKAE